MVERRVVADGDRVNPFSFAVIDAFGSQMVGDPTYPDRTNGDWIPRLPRVAARGYGTLAWNGGMIA
jgi:hypothetical protein